MTAFNDSCKVDAACVATVSGYEIIVNPGDIGPVIRGKTDVWSEDIGKTVKVRARKVDSSTLTIEGDESYFVLKSSE